MQVQVNIISGPSATAWTREGGQVLQLGQAMGSDSVLVQNCLTPTPSLLSFYAWPKLQQWIIFCIISGLGYVRTISGSSAETEGLSAAARTSQGAERRD